MGIRLPSRYEDLDASYRGRLKPNKRLLDLIIKADKLMKINGGIRFLPIFGESGAGKSCAAREISTHLPQVVTFVLAREDIEDKKHLVSTITEYRLKNPSKLLVAIVDQYEEGVAGKENIPTQFVEHLSLLDREQFKEIPIVFIWLTTNRQFQEQLVSATTRNRRLLLESDFVIVGPQKDEWSQIIEETFSLHNNEKSLADYGIISADIESIGFKVSTIGAAIQEVSSKLSLNLESLQNLSEYQVVLLWPVANGARSERVLQFTKPREGYKLNWDAWYTELNEEDRNQLPLAAFNRTRLYFDFRVIPIRAADIHHLCHELDNEDIRLGSSYIVRFKKTHAYHVISGTWRDYSYSPVRERESKRAKEAEVWYSSVTTVPTKIGHRIAAILRKCGLPAENEKDIPSAFKNLRADVFVDRHDGNENKVIIELKVFSSENTMPSTIKEQIKITLRRHAQFAGFIVCK